ncbi:MAG: cellulase family glycosylhydrolase [Nannocystaceae bacterium]
MRRRSALVLALTAASACNLSGGGDGTATTSGSTGGTESDGSSSSGGVLVGTCDPPIEAIVAADAHLTVDGSGRLRDALGRDVILRGVNTGGRSKWAPFMPFPIDPEIELEAFGVAADIFFVHLETWGLGAVRMPFSWEALEPAPGVYDERYLDRLEVLIDRAWAHGLRVVLDFHQDIYASPFCGDGFPLWTIGDPNPGPPRHDCVGWGYKYYSDDGVRGAFDRLWADEDGIQGAMRAMWAHVLDRLGAHPGLVGFEILNEPGWGTASDVAAWKSAVLEPFYSSMIAELGPLAPDLLIFYDDPGVDALALSDVNILTPTGDRLVYAPHLYDVGLIAGEAYSGIAPDPKFEGMLAHRSATGIPILLGEFGVGAGGVDQGGREWLTSVVDRIDAERLSATLWECSQNEELWNEEDLSLLGPLGEEQALVDVYVRPWLRALAGADATFQWDASAASGSASWTASGEVSEVILPARLFPGGPGAVEVTGAGACYTWDVERSELRVRADAGAAVQVSFAVGG